MLKCKGKLGKDNYSSNNYEYISYAYNYICLTNGSKPLLYFEHQCWKYG